MENNKEFWQFSDQLRLHTNNLANLSLSLSDSIWSDRRSNLTNLNVDPTTATSDDSSSSWKLIGPTVSSIAPPPTNNNNQKLAFGFNNLNRPQTNNITDSNSSKIGNNYDSNNNNNYFNNSNFNNGMVKNYFNKAMAKPAMSAGFGVSNRRNNNNNSNSNSNDGKKKGISNGKDKDNNNNNNNNNNGVDKRFKTLPPSEALPRSEAVGGYIFVCNNDTMQENLKRQLFGLPPRYRDSVRAITPGLPLFLYNYSTHQLHGIFEAASFGGTNIDPTAWEDKKSHGESRFPAQVKVMMRKICEPLEEDSFRPILHHYDGPKFRLELSVPEALALLDIFAENNA